MRSFALFSRSLLSVILLCVSCASPVEAGAGYEEHSEDLAVLGPSHTWAVFDDLPVDGEPQYHALGGQTVACVDACVVTGPAAFWLGALFITAVGSSWYIINNPVDMTGAFGPFPQLSEARQVATARRTHARSNADSKRDPCMMPTLPPDARPDSFVINEMVVPSQRWLVKAQVETYMKLLCKGVELLPIELYYGEDYQLLVDGHHRFMASQITGRPLKARRTKQPPRVLKRIEWSNVEW